MQLLLVSTYEMGHQPVHLASPAAALQRAGHDVHCLDLSVQEWDRGAIEAADAVAFSVPMHTAMRLAMRAAEQVRAIRPNMPICFYGLYAPVSQDVTVGRLVDQVIAGEYEPGLVAWANAVGGPPGITAGGPADARQPTIQLGKGRGTFHRPARELLPPLEAYAHLAVDGQERPVGYVEATHGCKHTCRHCPVPTVYDGAFRVVDESVVLDDVAQLVEAGARHITFGDPDFLNGPTHALRVARGLHERFPDVTFDCTVKAEHIVHNEGVWEELAACGCLFVVCAVESLNDDLLALLDKNHTAAQATEAVEILRRHDIELRPSFLPFTPWTTVQDVVDVFDWVIAHDLIGNVDPVQYSIRLLIPEGSLLLERPELTGYLGPYDAERLTYTWTAADPATEELQAELAEIAERSAENGAPTGATFLEMNAAVRRAAGQATSSEVVHAGDVEERPRLTEPWFC